MHVQCMSVFFRFISGTKNYFSFKQGEKYMYKKKVISKFVMLLMVSIMAVNCLASTAKAAFVNNTGTITVNGIETGVTVTAYLMMSENFDFSVQQPSDPRYIWREEIASWVNENYPEYIDTENLDAVTDKFSEASDAQIAEFYDKLSVAIKNGTVTPANQAIVSESDSVVYDPVLTGNYLILIENGVRVYRPLTANVLHEWNESVWEIKSAVVEAKASEPTVTKTVTADQKKDHFGIGDTISYELNALIPAYPENAIAKQFVVSDKLPESLTFSADSIKVYGVNAGEEPVLLSDSYTKTSARPTGEEDEKTVTFSLNFKYEKIAAYSSLKITYDAVLNKKAVIGDDGNINQAYMDYNNNPYAEGSWKSDDDQATVYTYGMKITKVDEDTEEPLSGAAFYLYKDDERIKFVNENGIYRVAMSDEGGLSILEVDEQGELSIHGLDAGTYELEEEYAPDGYVKLQHPVEIVIADEDFDGKAEADGEELEDGIMTVTVKNGKGFTLPVTGGIGTILFSMSGILMMGAGLLLIVAFFRKNEAK